MDCLLSWLVEVGGLEGWLYLICVSPQVWKAFSVLVEELVSEGGWGSLSWRSLNWRSFCFCVCALAVVWAVVWAAAAAAVAAAVSAAVSAAAEWEVARVWAAAEIPLGFLWVGS